MRLLLDSTSLHDKVKELRAFRSPSDKAEYFAEMDADRLEKLARYIDERNLRVFIRSSEFWNG